MTSKKRIGVMIGGAHAEATALFAALVARALEDKFILEAYPGGEVFSHLARCHVLVLAGYHSPAAGESYMPLTREQKQNFGAFVSSGRPIVSTPEGVASFPDWPRYGELVGYELLSPLHPPSALDSPCDLEIYAESAAFLAELHGTHLANAPAVGAMARPGMDSDTLALGRLANGDHIPLALCAKGGPRPGAGLTMFLDMGPAWSHALSPATTARLWRQALLWLVDEAENADRLC
jgi:hypothetical protein